MSKLTEEELDFLLEHPETIKQPKKAHKRTIEGRSIKVKSSLDVARDTYKRVKKQHKAEIARNRNSIAKHRQLIKQARGVYKLAKLEAKK